MCCPQAYTFKKHRIDIRYEHLGLWYLQLIQTESISLVRTELFLHNTITFDSPQMTSITSSCTCFLLENFEILQGESAFLV